MALNLLCSGVWKLLLWLAPENRPWHQSHYVQGSENLCSDSGTRKQTMASVTMFRGLKTSVLTLAPENRPRHKSLCSGVWKLLLWLWHQKIDHGIKVTIFRSLKTTVVPLAPENRPWHQSHYVQGSENYCCDSSTRKQTSDPQPLIRTQITDVTRKSGSFTTTTTTTTSF